MSDTPRTDAFKRLAAESGLCGEEENHQTILFARTLERELAAVKERLAEALSYKPDADRWRRVQEVIIETLNANIPCDGYKRAKKAIDAAMKEPK